MRGIFYLNLLPPGELRSSHDLVRRNADFDIMRLGRWSGRYVKFFDNRFPIGFQYKIRHYEQMRPGDARPYMLRSAIDFAEPIGFQQKYDPYRQLRSDRP